MFHLRESHCLEVDGLVGGSNLHIGILFRFIRRGREEFVSIKKKVFFNKDLNFTVGVSLSLTVAIPLGVACIKSVCKMWECDFFNALHQTFNLD